MNNSSFLYKELSFLVLGKKMYSVVFGNWANPERVIFMFSGNSGTWLTDLDDTLEPISLPSETYAAKMIQSAPPGDAYIFFNRFGYQYSDPASNLFFIEDIPNFYDAIRNTLIEAIEQPPKEIINFGYSAGGILILIDMVLGNENSIDPINTKTDSNFLVFNDRKNYHWIIVDPLLTNKIFFSNIIKERIQKNLILRSIASLFTPILFNFLSSLYIVNKNKNKFGFFMGLFAEYCRQILIYIGENNINYRNFFLKKLKMDLNFVEIIDLFSFYRQKNCLNLLEKSKGKQLLHVVGFFSFNFGFYSGFATNKICENQMKDIANLSKYSNSYLRIIAESHTSMSLHNGDQIFNQILQFAYNNLEKR